MSNAEWITTREVPCLLSPNLHALSPSFSPICCSGGRFLLFNMEHVRDCMLLDTCPSSGDMMWYEWAGPRADRPTCGATAACIANFHDSGMRLYDGSFVVVVRKALTVVKGVHAANQDDPNVDRMLGALSILADAPRFGHCDETWTNMLASTKILVHTPLLQRQSVHDARFDELAPEKLRNNAVGITVFDTGDVKVGSKVYRRASSKDS